MPIEKVCDNCGISFLVPPARKNTARFCSSKCKNEKKDWAKTKVDCVCEYCGKKFQTWEAWLRKKINTGKYCSRLCKDESQKRVDVPIAKFIESYKNGLSSVQIGKKYGVPDTVVRRRLHESDVEMRTAEEGIRLAYEQGKTKNQLNKPERVKNHCYWLIYAPDHPRADRSGRVRENIYVWEQANGKVLPMGWVVHHINEIKDDNRPENLEAMPWGKHTKLHGDLRAMELENTKGRIKQLEEENRKLRDLVGPDQASLIH